MTNTVNLDWNNLDSIILRQTYASSVITKMDSGMKVH